MGHCSFSTVLSLPQPPHSFYWISRSKATLTNILLSLIFILSSPHSPLSLLFNWYQLYYLKYALYLPMFSKMCSRTALSSVPQAQASSPHDTRDISSPNHPTRSSRTMARTQRRRLETETTSCWLPHCHITILFLISFTWKTISPVLQIHCIFSFFF